MNIDFHYGVIYLLGRLAGLEKQDAETVAHAGQYVDDSTVSGMLEFEGGESYERFASAHKMFDYMNINNTSDKTLYVRSLQGSIKAPSGEATADAVSAVDFDRYFLAFPPLKNGAQPALPPETKIQPGERVARTIIVVFPITLDAFNLRTSTSAVIWPYDQTVPVTLTK